jgi:ABC-2 type transport system ATP-binding protein
MSFILAIEDLVVDRGNNFVLGIPNLKIKQQSIVCIGGSNGSGKSTLLHCMAGLLTPQSGIVTVEGASVGKNLRATKLLIGFVPDDEEWIIKELCADEYFDLLASVYQAAGCTTDTMGRAKELAELLSFTAFRQLLGSLSHGNIKKVQLIAALMHAPKIIILDEVRNGLDPMAILAVEQLLKQERDRGACIVAATHDLWWAERLSDRFILIANGSLQVDQKTTSLLAKFGSLENVFIKKNGLTQ